MTRVSHHESHGSTALSVIYRLFTCPKQGADPEKPFCDDFLFFSLVPRRRRNAPILKRKNLSELDSPGRDKKKIQKNVWGVGFFRSTQLGHEEEVLNEAALRPLWTPPPRAPSSLCALQLRVSLSTVTVVSTLPPKARDWDADQCSASAYIMVSPTNRH